MRNSDLTKIMNIRTDAIKKKIEDSGIKVRLTDTSIWHKVYKDCVFDETLFYTSKEVTAICLLKDAYIAEAPLADFTGLPNKMAFHLDTVPVYPTDIDQTEKALSSLIERYKKLYEVYQLIKDDIDRANKSIEDVAKNVEFRELYKYIGHTEKQLNCQLQSLMAISEMP